jgi:hypothetical protein
MFFMVKHRIMITTAGYWGPLNKYLRCITYYAPIMMEQMEQYRLSL